MPPLLTRFSIRSKVIAVFTVLLCCVGGLDLIALQHLVAVKAAIADVRDNQVPSVLLLNEMAAETAQFRLLEAKIALTADAGATRDIAAMTAAQEQAIQSFRAYYPLAGPGVEQQMADATLDRWQAYLTLHDRFIAGMQGGDAAGLTSLYLGEMRAASDSFRSALQPLIRFNIREIREGAELGAAVAESAFRSIIALITVIGLACAGLGWSLINGVSVPIARMTDAMRRLAQHDMTTAIPGLGRGDEIGAMAGAVQVFKEGLIDAARLNAERETARAAELHRLRQFANATFEGIVIHQHGTIIDANLPFAQMLDHPDPGALAGRSVVEFVAPDSLDDARDRLRRHAREAGELVMQRADGSRLPVEVLSRVFDYDGTDTTLSAIRDLSERKRAEERIRQLAYHDALTGLPNRYLLSDRLTQAIELSARTGGQLAVLCLDLDRFKFVNDLFGHEAGDRLLVEVARRLSATVRGMDTVARFGGDEFIVVQAVAEQPHLSAALAGRLIECLSAPYEIDDQHVEIGVSIGIATYPADGDTVSALLKNGDIAMYRAKTGGRGQYQFFAAEMDVQLRTRRALEQDLRQAFARRELELYFQPLFDCAERRLQGFEALLRWIHPVRGAVPPGEFIPIAEESGLIVPLGRWVLEEACSEAARWRGKWSIAVNISPIQFQDPGLADTVAETLAHSGLDPKRLELEVTEGVLIRDADQAMATLTRLRALGVRISLDDFGTGYSSLSYLRRFPFDKLKIDRSFIQDCDTNPEASGIVAAIVALGQCLDIAVVAEGVESESQLRLLAEQHCHQAQGYLLGRPQPASRLADFMVPFELALG
jgi:diguanylate cyclase